MNMGEYIQRIEDGLKGVRSDIAQKVGDAYTGFSENPSKYTKETMKGVVRDYWDLALALSGVAIASKLGDDLVSKYIGENYIGTKDTVGSLMWGASMLAPLTAFVKGEDSLGVIGKMGRNLYAGVAGFMFLGMETGTYPVFGALASVGVVFGDIIRRRAKKIHEPTTNSQQGLENLV
jgi:hypothetical protein